MEHFREERKFEDISRNKSFLARSLSGVKRVMSSPEGETSAQDDFGKLDDKRAKTDTTEGDITLTSNVGVDNTSREGENLFAKDPTYETIMMYYEEESIAKELRGNKLYKLVDDNLRNFHKFVDNTRGIIHTCYGLGYVGGEAFKEFVEKSRDINKEIDGVIKKYESDKIVLLGRLVDKLEKSTKKLEKREEEIIGWQEGEKWKEIENLYWIMEEQKRKLHKKSRKC